jgi:hypothetical protein
LNIAIQFSWTALTNTHFTLKIHRKTNRYASEESENQRKNVDHRKRQKIFRTSIEKIKKIPPKGGKLFYFNVTDYVSHPRDSREPFLYVP